MSQRQEKQQLPRKKSGNVPKADVSKKIEYHLPRAQYVQDQGLTIKSSTSEPRSSDPDNVASVAALPPLDEAESKEVSLADLLATLTEEEERQYEEAFAQLTRVINLKQYSAISLENAEKSTDERDKAHSMQEYNMYLNKIEKELDPERLKIVKDILAKRPYFAEEDHPSDDEAEVVKRVEEEEDWDREREVSDSDQEYASGDEETEPEVISRVVPLNLPKVQPIKNEEIIRTVDDIIKEYRNNEEVKTQGDLILISKKKSILTEIIRNYKEEPEFSHYFHELNLQFSQRGERVLFDYLIQHGMTKVEASQNVSKYDILLQMMTELKDKLLQDQVEILIYFIIQPNETVSSQLLRDYTQLSYDWRALESRLIRPNPSIKDAVEQKQENPYLLEASLESYTKKITHKDPVTGNEETMVVQKSKDDYKQDQDRLMALLVEFAKRDRPEIAWRLIDHFFVKRLERRPVNLSLNEQIKSMIPTILAHEYNWVLNFLFRCDLDPDFLPRTLKLYETITHTKPERNKKCRPSKKDHDVQQDQQSDEEEEYDMEGLPIAKKKQDNAVAYKPIFIPPQNLLYPRPKFFYTNPEIVTYLAKVNTASELFRINVDRDFNSPTFGKRVRIPVNIGEEQVDKEKFSEYLPLIQCIIILVRRLTLIHIKDTVVHLDELTKDQIRKSFRTRLDKSWPLYKVMITTMSQDLYMERVIQESIVAAEQELVEFLIPQQQLSRTKRLIVPGLQRRAMRQERLHVYRHINVNDTPLSYACRVKCEDLVVRPLDSKNTTFPYVYPRQEIIVENTQDVFYYPTLWLKGKLCSDDIVVTDANITVEGQRFFLARYAMNPELMQREIKEFTTPDYHNFLPYNGLSVKSHFIDLFQHKQAYLSHIYDQVERDMNHINLGEVLPELLVIITTKFSTRNVQDILLFFYCIISLRDPTFQLNDDMVWNELLPRITFPENQEKILARTDIVDAFYRIILRMNHEDASDKVVIDYTKAFLSHRLNHAFPFLDIHKRPLSELYLSNAVTMVQIRSIIKREVLPFVNVPSPMEVELEQEEKEESQSLAPEIMESSQQFEGRRVLYEINDVGSRCRYCHQVDAIPTIQFHKKNPRKVWVCEECLEKGFRVASR